MCIQTCIYIDFEWNSNFFWKTSPRFLEISLIFPRIQKSARSMREVKKHPWQNQPKPFPKLCNFGVRGLMVLDHKMSASEARMVDAHENVSTFGPYSTSCVRIWQNLHIRIDLLRKIFTLKIGHGSAREGGWARRAPDLVLYVREVYFGPPT